MNEFSTPALPAWQGFYYIIGSSGAALIGIQFVVITLIANMRLRPTSDSISAFCNADRNASSQRLAGLCHHERSMAFALSDVDCARDLRFWRSCVLCNRTPPRSSPNILQSRVGRLVLVRSVAVQHLHYAHDRRCVPANYWPGRSVSNRNCGLGPAAGRNSQCMGFRNAYCYEIGRRPIT